MIPIKTEMGDLDEMQVSQRGGTWTRCNGFTWTVARSLHFPGNRLISRPGRDPKNSKQAHSTTYHFEHYCLYFLIMLVKQSYRDVKTKANGREGTIRIYVIESNVPEYPEAKFPGCQCSQSREETRDKRWRWLMMPRCRLFGNLPGHRSCRTVR